MAGYNKRKFEIVSAALARYPYHSDRAIAEITSISAHTVGKYRANKGLSTNNLVEADGRRTRGRVRVFKYHDERLPDDTTTIYRAYHNSELLYVGLSFVFMQRLATHGRKHWWHDITHITTTHFNDRHEAEVAQKVAIHTEQPRYNVINMSGGKLLIDTVTRTAIRPSPPAPVRPTPASTATPGLIKRPTGRIKV